MLNRFNGFLLGKPLKRFTGSFPTQITALKCGANENFKLTQ
jgi:hypothetical protein